ncbi:MAG: type II toxin-antitoxin system RelE/ParE family toxin [Candidatus Aminicenantes bacterium]|nr:type II toxin-antitoxin system RelE/ParE family toxin [Candidatus Aminicenantes bacterium]
MTRRDIRYLSAAEKDLLGIYDYARQDNPRAAAAFIGKIGKAVGRLAEHPYLGAVPKDERLAGLGYRVLVVENILVFNVVKPTVVQIRRVLHGARRFDFLLE